ncbi:MAG: DnaB-like helicase N-terminal domain-containing protein, partial [Veillonella sp.]|nr:DnaB-like helicase N-terminal domain-containing protein [Veillonella sp.]
MDVRIPPHNEDAEKAVLGALLTDGSSSGEAVDLVTSIVDRDDFYRDTHRIIYDAILNLVKSNKTVDFITLSEELERRKKLDTVGGIAYITSLANEATGYNIEDAGEDEPTVIMNKAEQLVLDVGGQTQSESTFSPIRDIVLTNIDRLNKLQQHKGSITGVPTGFRDLDFKLNGLQRSDLILVAARPAMGKTAFTLNIAQNVAMGIKRTVAFFSLEMSKEQLVGRILSSV